MLMGRINNMLVDLIGDDKGVVLYGQSSNLLQFLSGEHFAAGIGRVAEN